MVINITNAVEDANLLVDDMFLTYANNYTSPVINYSNTNDIMLFNGISSDSQKAGVVYSPRYSDGNDPQNHVRVFDVKADGDNFTYSDDYYSYDSKKPLKIMFVTNPIVPGAFAVKINEFENTLLTSGDLTGCSVAVLKKGENVYFAHAGAGQPDMVTKGFCEQQAHRNKDLINAILRLDTPDCSAINQGISIDNLYSMLLENGFSGLLVTQSDILNQKIMCNQQQKIYHHTYTERSNVLCLCNNELVSMGCRIIKAEHGWKKEIDGRYGLVLHGNRG